MKNRPTAKSKFFAPCARITLACTMGALMASLLGCSGINDSWEVNGGGYFKYTFNDEGPYTIELEKDDVEPPYYVNNQHHYFYFHTQAEASDRRDEFALMVNSPSTGKDLTPVSRASISGKSQYVTWMIAEGSSQSPIIADSSYIHFDEIIGDSLWTADVNLYFTDCRSGSCKDNLPPLHVEGRLRYWVPDSER